MDPQIGWIQPEQSGPAKEFWMQIWETYMINRDNVKVNSHENHLLNKFQENIENIPDNLKTRTINMNHMNNIANGSNKASTCFMNRFQDAIIGKYGGCPWRTGHIYDTNTTVGLHQEIEEFFEYMSPTREEHQIRVNLVSNIKSIILSLWPNSQVEVFGSFQTSLYLPTSDIDMVVIGEWDQLPLRTLQDALLNSGICDPDNVKVLDKASVPIVKFNDRHSDVKVDISFNMKNGVKSVELIKGYCQTYPALKKLVLVLKQFLLQRDLNEVFHGGISSYSLILMCVSFLQMNYNQDPRRPDYNLGILLIEFFELYGRRFNYINTAISVKGNGSYIAKDQLQKDMTDGHRPSILSIEDPLTQGNDIGRGSYGAFQVKHAFEYAYIVISQAISLGIDTNKSSILGRIIRVTDRVIDYRIWIRKAFPVTKHSMTVHSSHSNDGSISSLPSTDSDSESSHGQVSDSFPTVLPASKFTRRSLNGVRCSGQTTAYARLNSINSTHHGFQKHPQHHPMGSTVAMPLLNHISHHIHTGYQRHFNQYDMLNFQKYHNNNRICTSQYSSLPHAHHKRPKSQQYNRPRNITEINSFR